MPLKSALTSVVCLVMPMSYAMTNTSVSAIAPGSPPPVSSVVDLGPIVQNPHVLFRDGLFSGEFHGVSIWTFGDTALNAPNSEGVKWDDNSLAYTKDLDGSAGLSLMNDVPETPAGVPDQYLPSTPAEQAFNHEHALSGGTCEVQPCGEEYALWNGPVVPDPARNRVLFFYYELERILGKPGWTTIGEGIATWSPGGPLVRPIESPGSSFPTLMFGPHAPDFADGALTVRGMLYAYGCTSGFWVQNCVIGRVPLAAATDRPAWRFYTATGSWSPDFSDAVTVIQGGAGGTSVFWVPYLGEYMAIYMPPLTNEIVARVARTPWGPWSAQRNIAPTLPPAAGTVDYAGMAHPEFAQQDGRVQYVAYYHPLGPFSGEDRWVQVTLGKAPSNSLTQTGV